MTLAYPDDDRSPIGLSCAQETQRELDPVKATAALGPMTQAARQPAGAPPYTATTSRGPQA